jgi:enoyl-CoA hydratase/carnithine racemase
MTESTLQFDLIRYEVSGRVAKITLCDPAHMNAITHGPASMDSQMLEALDLAERDDAVHCIIFTGEGSVFSSGGSLAGGHPAGDAGEFLAFQDSSAVANARIRRSSKPTIGAINGICYGAALILALHLDLLIASEKARFGLIETRFGGPGVECLPFFVGLPWAKFLAMSGETISARKAREIGLILECFPEDKFMGKVDDLARRIAAMPREGVMLNRRLLNGISTLMGWNEAHAELSASFGAIVNAMTAQARAVDGRLLLDLLHNEGWHSFKSARDAAFQPPWLDK